VAETLLNFHGIEETLKDPPDGAVLHVGRKNARTDALRELAQRQGVRVQDDPPEAFERLAGKENKGAALLLPGGRKTRELSIEGFIENLSAPMALVVLLDGVTDPQNYGAILRSADQFGADLVVIPARRSASDTPAVFAASAGAAAWVPHAVVPNLVRAMELLKSADFWIYGADMAGTPASQAQMKGRVALVLGGEGKGLSRLVRQTCDVIVSIPTQGKIDSLNVSVAAGILMYEIRREAPATFTESGKPPRVQ
jgi:23S rRNA (guanosine2251-2'-O)-methyltransferase